MTRRTAKPSPTAALLALTGFCMAAAPAVAQEQPLDPYPPQPPPGVLIAPPQRVPPPLPIAPPPSLPIDPYGPHYIAPPPPRPLPPYLVAPPTWGSQEGCNIPGCGESPGAQLSYTPRSPAGAGEMEKRPRYGLMAAGISILGGLWTLSLSSGILTQHYELAIPVIGPFFTASDIGKSSNPWDGRSALVGLLAFDGIFQTAGLIMAIAGGTSRVSVPRRRPTQPTFYPSMGGFYGRF